MQRRRYLPVTSLHTSSSTTDNAVTFLLLDLRNLLVFLLAIEVVVGLVHIDSFSLYFLDLISFNREDFRRVVVVCVEITAA